MKKFQKCFLAFSCFLPLYLIFLLKNALASIKFAFCEFSIWSFWYNLTMSIVWLLFTIFSVVGIIAFKKLFLNAYQNAKEEVTILSAENVTKDYYFTYFTLFVLTFFTVNPTCLLDTIILIFLMILIWIVYLRNDMFFINPILNIMGYKSVKIKYVKTMLNATENHFEAYVFTREKSLKVSEDKKYSLSFSQYDFTVCYDKESHKSKAI